MNNKIKAMGFEYNPQDNRFWDMPSYTLGLADNSVILAVFGKENWVDEEDRDMWLGTVYVKGRAIIGNWMADPLHMPEDLSGHDPVQVAYELVERFRNRVHNLYSEIPWPNED